MNNVLFKSGITRLPLRHRSKVRDIYGIDGQHLLMVTTERLSASGAVLPTPIPGNFILAETPPVDVGWQAANDRLRRAVTVYCPTEIQHQEKLHEEIR